MSESRLKGPVRFPACSMAEMKMLSYFSACAIKSRYPSPSQGSIQVYQEVTQPLMEATIVAKHYLFGEPTALVVKSSNPGLEGMIVSEPYRGSVRRTCRHLYADAHFPRQTDQQMEESQLAVKLDYLRLPYPEKNDRYIDTLMALLALCNIDVGDHFYSNILNFSAWLSPKLTADNHQNWKSVSHS